jgi:putative nucleotidyltransferase with HDIG domain
MSSASPTLPGTAVRAQRASAARGVAETHDRPPTRTHTHERHTRGGHAQRLHVAFAALDTFPALRESRDRMLAACAAEQPVIRDVVSAVESDIALTIAVLRAANAYAGAPRRARVDNVIAAVESLTPQALRAIAGEALTFDFFEQVGVWGSAPANLRLHSLATQRAADRIAALVHYDNRDRLAVSSLLHDIGKLVLARAYPGYPREVLDGARTLDERVQMERRELGIDHALIGAVLVARLDLPAPLANAIEHHHDVDASGEAATVRLADMIANYELGARVPPNEMLGCARAVGLDADGLRELLYGLHGAPARRQEAVRDCPLSGRELKLLERLAEGHVYKQIALELTLSVSTIRTHLHNIYGKLGVVNRAQAVLMATERGWILRRTRLAGL